MSATCGRCGSYVSESDSRCPSCGAVFTNSVGPKTPDTFAGLLAFLIFFPIFNLPAFLPAAYITKLLCDAVIIDATSSLIGRIFAIAISLIFFSAFMWGIFKQLLIFIERQYGPIKVIGRFFFWGYILFCYGALGYAISLQCDVTSSGRMIITGLSALVGGGWSVSRLTR